MEHPMEGKDPAFLMGKSQFLMGKSNGLKGKSPFLMGNDGINGHFQ
jgi:hypothetical protein